MTRLRHHAPLMRRNGQTAAIGNRVSGAWYCLLQRYTSHSWQQLCDTEPNMHWAGEVVSSYCQYFSASTPGKGYFGYTYPFLEVSISLP